MFTTSTQTSTSQVAQVDMEYQAIRDEGDEEDEGDDGDEGDEGDEGFWGDWDDLEDTESGRLNRAIYSAMDVRDDAKASWIAANTALSDVIDRDECKTYVVCAKRVARDARSTLDAAITAWHLGMPGRLLLPIIWLLEQHHQSDD
jgi:hypothetical protein